MNCAVREIVINPIPYLSIVDGKRTTYTPSLLRSGSTLSIGGHLSKRAHIHADCKATSLSQVLKTVSQCRRSGDLETWREALKTFCPAALEDEEMAGRVVKLIEEYKRSVQNEAVIPRFGCGDEVLDLCLLEGMVCGGRLEEALLASESLSNGKKK